MNATVEALIDVAKQRTPQDVSTWLYKYVNERIDAELELLASHFLEEGFNDIMTCVEVRSLLSRGAQHEAVRVALSRLRRRVSKTLRDHQRSEDDAFLDACVQE